MKKTAIWAVLALAPLLAACSPSAPAPAPSESATSENSPMETTSDAAPSSDAAADASGLKASCQKFNELAAKLRTMSYPDSSGYMNLYTESQTAAESAPAETKKALTAIGILALDYTKSDTLPQEDKDRMTQEWQAISAPCSSAGVTAEL
ncbi:hypothetical protein [Arthrobacter sp. NPDC090010]|uniref:hypothetical protein n=1 Tax=Arthrobacter sp. NPDC090010 TaxID=3363942 RepID=UPI003812F403